MSKPTLIFDNQSHFVDITSEEYSFRYTETVVLHGHTFKHEIKRRVTYKKWFFGHYHTNMNVNDKEILIYEQIIRIV